MSSSLFDYQEFLFEDGWDMTTLHQEAATFTDSTFWEDIEAEVSGLAMVPPADVIAEVFADVAADVDWAVEDDEERKVKVKAELVNNDRMWGGADDTPIGQSLLRTSADDTPTGQSLLRTSSADARTDRDRPDTPPSLDDDREPPEFRHAVDVAGTALRLLRDSAAVAADHSYTLVEHADDKQTFDSLGVCTPTDSEEEIDVVSVNEKSGQAGASPRDELPRVPSVLDRHHIQRTMASAMSPRRASASPPHARKRPSPPSSSGGHSPAGRKRARGPGRRPRRSSPDTDSDADMPDLEKRSLHNDMERMRRIGLKNLFDQLKEQVPATRDKERAPKVVILREAASLCRRLQAEDRERETLRRHQARLLAKLKKLRSVHAAARSYSVPVLATYRPAPPPALRAH